MRPLILLAACIAGALLTGALLAYPLHALLPFSYMQYHKVVPIATEFTAVAFSLLFLRATAGLDRTSLGFGFGAHDIRRDLPVALFAGAAFVAVLETALLLLGIHVPATSASMVGPGSLARLLFAAIAVGLLVAVVEETLFRGALVSGLKPSTGAAGALLLTSAAYAAAHFVKFPPLPAGAEVHWYTSLEMLSQAFTRFRSPIVIDSFITLFALGLLLGLMRLARGHIAQCIGFHAGVVAGLKAAAEFADYSRGSGFDFLVNRWDPELGWLPTILLSAVTIGYVFLFMLGVRRP